jgi:hypothetical protein
MPTGISGGLGIRERTRIPAATAKVRMRNTRLRNMEVSIYWRGDPVKGVGLIPGTGGF